MLKTSKAITLRGNSIIDGKNVVGYQAIIDSDNPIEMTVSNWQMDKILYKENREQCYADLKEFEDAAYKLQNAMIEELETVSE